MARQRRGKEEQRGAEKREERDWAADMAGIKIDSIKIDSIKKDRMRIGMPRQHNAKRKRLNANA